MKEIVFKIFGALLLVCGLAMFLYPTIVEHELNNQTAAYLKEYEEKYPTNSVDDKLEVESEGEAEKTSNEKDSAKTSKKNSKLFKAIKKYNKDLYQSGQESFRDAWSYTQVPVEISGLQDDKFGYIYLPTMNDTILPLYLGASESNMSKGAAILGQTSIPIGGENTNSVIAGHRGWDTGPFFKYIEDLSIGDFIHITNPWETITYRVDSIDIILPNDSDKVRIQDGKDMVTLMTCHPYLSRGKYRYIVYCVRDESGALKDEKGNKVGKPPYGTKKNKHGNNNPKEIVSSDGIKFESSQDLLDQEVLIQRIGTIIIVLLVIIGLLRKLFKKKV